MTPRSIIHAAAVAVLAASGTAASAAAQLPARALVPDGPLHVGGYANVVLSRGHGTDLDGDLDFSEAIASALVSGRLTRSLSYFGEIEAAGRSRQNWAGEAEAETLEIERLYLEYAFADALRVRAGRFLTPVGQWNENHAAPLTWTSVRPMTTFRPFAKSLTGLLVAGNIAAGTRDLGYAVYWAPAGLANAGGAETAFLRALGARAAIEIAPDLIVGASIADIRASRLRPADEDAEGGDADERDEDHEGRGLFAADASWRFARTELLAEATLLTASSESPREIGVFLQTATPVWRELHLVLRGEYYEPVDDSALRVLAVGAAYRFGTHLTLKLERQLPRRPSGQVPHGWFAAASVLF